MLHRTTQLDGCRVFASDGEMGEIRDVYFDDQHWVVRYLGVDTGGWLSGSKVLISPHAVDAVHPAARAVAVKLHRAKVEHSPHIDTQKPVSRLREAEYYRNRVMQSTELDSVDSPLRSAAEVTSYPIHATDDEIGHVEDFLFDLETWRICLRRTFETHPHRR